MVTIHKRNNFIILFIIFIATLGCDTNTVYETFKKVDVNGWDYHDELVYILSIEKHKPLDFNIAIRNTSDYTKANLWLFTTVTSPAGNVKKDTINCILADDYGYWLGDGFSGLYLTTHSMSKSFHFNETGKWKIEIVHGMREDTIKGIKEIGILINR